MKIILNISALCLIALLGSGCGSGSGKIDSCEKLQKLEDGVKLVVAAYEKDETSKPNLKKLISLSDSACKKLKVMPEITCDLKGQSPGEKYNYEDKYRELCETTLPGLKQKLAQL